MKILVTILLFLVSSFTFAQTSFLKDAAAKFDKALMSKDTVVLKQLLHKDLTYGHSNGWVETKRELINNLVTDKLTYKKIESSEVSWVTVKDIATMRNKTILAYVLDGKPGELVLHVLQVWQKTNKGWQLLSRQSAKLENVH